MTRREPVLRLGEGDATAQVSVPPGAFLQASSHIQAAMTAALSEAIGEPIDLAIDLYSGLGSFSLPLLAKARRVHAVEGDGPALDALENAVKRSQLADRVTIERRDLEAWPLQGKEVSRCQALVFDPPRAGAKTQAPQIAAARVPLVVAVSCNPATLQRDLLAFAQAGYRLDWAQGFDQFLWSAHIEAMAVLRLEDAPAA
jgi:23S rRNA (uracil1939-C5)-methyltransferase